MMVVFIVQTTWGGVGFQYVGRTTSSGDLWIIYAVGLLMNCCLPTIVAAHREHPTVVSAGMWRNRRSGITLKRCKCFRWIRYSRECARRIALPSISRILERPMVEVIGRYALKSTVKAGTGKMSISQQRMSGMHCENPLILTVLLYCERRMPVPAGNPSIRVLPAVLYVCQKEKYREGQKSSGSRPIMDCLRHQMAAKIGGP